MLGLPSNYRNNPIQIRSNTMTKKQTSNQQINSTIKQKGIDNCSNTKTEKQMLSKVSFVPGVVFTNGTDIFTLASGENQLYIEDLKTDQILDVASISDTSAKVHFQAFGCILSGLLIYSNYKIISTPIDFA